MSENIKKIGIVDLGSNSFRLLLGTYEASQWQWEPKRLWSTRLGKRSTDGNLTAEAIERSLDALVEIQEAIKAYGATQVVGVATSAIREASNGADFMAKAMEVCPMESHIISGEEEATLGFEGAVTTFPADSRHYGLIDIGGGSTEIALGTHERTYWQRSYPIGAVRLKERSDEGPQEVWQETRPWFEPLPIEGPFGEFIAVGGTATTLAAMHLKLEVYNPGVIQGHQLSREVIEAMLLELRYMTPEERLAVPGLPSNRADIIVAGGEILTSFMDWYEIPYVIVSERDGMEGMAARLVK
ncbi:phosphatase [Veillonella intestinalis]|uniref:Ppx/GppA phosphatase family protein n=1 Tax=Veillonella intestinalis TaxID=2941341 RepID=UPI00203BEE15|nr:phosphatase [Veillonella intestinalis]